MSTVNRKFHEKQLLMLLLLAPDRTWPVVTGAGMKEEEFESEKHRNLFAGLSMMRRRQEASDHPLVGTNRVILAEYSVTALAGILKGLGRLDDRAKDYLFSLSCAPLDHTSTPHDHIAGIRKSLTKEQEIA